MKVLKFYIYFLIAIEIIFGIFLIFKITNIANQKSQVEQSIVGLNSLSDTLSKESTWEKVIGGIHE